MSELYYPPTQNGLQKTLGADLNQGTTASATLNNTTGIQNKPGVMVVDRIDTDGNLKSTSVREWVIYEATSGSTVTSLTRGIGGSTDQDHSTGAVVEFVPDITVFEAIIDALANVVDPTTGLLDTTKVVDLTTAQTLTNKTLTSPKIGTSILDTNGNSEILFTATASAVNDITVTNAATGNAPQVSATGSDTNIDLKLAAKGTGKVKISGAYSLPSSDGSANQVLQTNGSGVVSFASAGSTDGWTSSSDTFTYASASSFTISGVDRTAVYTKGTRVKFTNNATTFYGVVISSSFSTNTTVNLAPNTDYSIANSAITAPYYSYEENPQGYPTWFNYTPTYGAGGSMTYTTVTTNVAKFKIDGKNCSTVLSATGTTGGTASSIITATLPITPDATIYRTSGSVDDPTGFGAWFANYSSAGSINCCRYDTSNFGIGTGRSIYCTFSFGF